VVWGGNDLHKDCAQKENTSSTPKCCNCQLVEAESAHQYNYRGGRHAKEEMQKRKSRRTPKTRTAEMSSSKFNTPSMTFTAARLF
jgi:hypothetical protein